MIDVALKESVQQYRAILDHAEQLERLLVTGNPEQLQDYTARLQSLQDEAGLSDRELLAETAQDSVRRQGHPLFRQRTQLLEQIMEMNDLLLPRVRGMMSVTAAELAQLKDGRAAVSGYHPAALRTKGSLGVG